MEILTSRAIAFCAGIALLAGCAANGTSPTATAALNGGGLNVLRGTSRPFIARTQTAVRPDRHKSWRSPKLKAAASGHLLFVSDSGTGDVYIYALPSFTLVSTLTGFYLPQGMCSDSVGHVWLANTRASQIVEFDHTGNVVNTLSDPGGWPVACAWDPTTHNLAVANIIDFDSNSNQVPGEVLVYPAATGTPTAYQDPDMYNYYAVAYHPKGALFFDGYRDYSNTTVGLDELPVNWNTPAKISISGGTIHAPAGLQWHQGLVIGDQACTGSYAPEVSCVYQVSLSHFSAAITGSTSLKDWSGYPACDVVQAVLGGQTLYGGDFEHALTYGFSCSDPYGSSAVYRWAYPGGGTPQRYNPTPFTSASVPNGTAISI